MKVRAVKNFPVIIDDQVCEIKEGCEFDLDKIDASVWLATGLVVPVREEIVETAVRTPQERAIIR